MVKLPQTITVRKLEHSAIQAVLSSWTADQECNQQLQLHTQLYHSLWYKFGSVRSVHTLCTELDCYRARLV